jgi:hypothetical protein
MSIVATRVHNTRFLRWKRDSALFLNGQGVNVGTESDDRGARADGSYNTSLCDRISAKTTRGKSKLKRCRVRKSRFEREAGNRAID